MTTARRSVRVTPWLWLGCDAVVVAVAVLWLVSREVWALLAWEAVGIVYVVVGFAVVWRGSVESNGSVEAARLVSRLSWILPLLASVVGVNAAIVALVARSGADAGSGQQTLLAVTASVGVVLSWIFLQVGFAEIYQSLDESDPDADAIEFPGRDTGAFLDYLYFSFTVGTAFATSDARVMTLAVRRVVLVQSVVAFFYNAIVVATAIQVLQQIVAG